MSTIAERLAAACAAVPGQKPEGRNQHDRYDFLSVHQIASVARKALADQSLALVPTAVDVLADEEIASKRGTAGRRVVVKVTWQLIAPEGSMTVQSIGEASDFSDKATGKAEQYARKWALIALLQMSAGEDPDEDSPEAAPRAAKKSERESADQRAQRLIKRAREVGLTDEQVIEAVSKVTEWTAGLATDDGWMAAGKAVRALIGDKDA